VVVDLVLLVVVVGGRVVVVVVVVVGGRMVVVVLDVAGGRVVVVVVEGPGAELRHARSVSSSVDPRAFRGCHISPPPERPPAALRDGRSPATTCKHRSSRGPCALRGAQGRMWTWSRQSADPTRGTRVHTRPQRHPVDARDRPNPHPVCGGWLAEQEGLLALPGARKTRLANAAK